MFKVGSDPEVLLVNTQGKLISSVGLIGGSKAKPKATPHGHVQEDNVLVEFNTKPAGSRSEFITNVQNMILDINSIITPLDLSVRIESSGLFDQDQLESMEALIAGCEPDWNSWTETENEAPALDMTNLRSCGGHLHVSFDRAAQDSEARFNLVKALDLVAGAPSILMDEDGERRKLYGNAGACRPKYLALDDEYDGVEYRTLSNFWLKSAKHIGWAYGAVETVMNSFDEWVAIANAERDVIVDCINTGDKRMAEALVMEYGLEVA